MHRSVAVIDLKVCRAVFSVANDDDDDRGFDYKPDRHSCSFVGPPQNQQATDKRPEVQTDFPILWARQSPTNHL